jgi:hypothetical protein
MREVIEVTDDVAALVRRAADTMVLAVSASDSDRFTAPQAARAALREGARLLAVHVGGALPPEHGRDAAEALADAVGLARSAAPGLPVAAALVSGDRVAVLQALSTTARRLYIGTSETRSVKPLVAGQVTVGLTRTTRCPVVMVRADRPARGSQVVAYLGEARERDVVAYAEQQARLLGHSLTVVHRGPLGETWPVGPDVSLTRVLAGDDEQARRAVVSRRNELLVVSAGDLHAERTKHTSMGMRARYAGTAPQIAIVPDGYSSTTPST